jgi:methylenetetrahydrofolate reductase (NADPH)
MKVTDHIKQAKETLFSFEILPPLKGEHFGHLEENISKLLSYNPAFIDVTYHQQEVEFRELPNGNLEKKTVRKRPGTVGMSAAIQYKTQKDVVPHIICGGFTKEDTENALIDLHFLGIDNILIVRGDPVSNQRYFVPEKEGHSHALGLVKQVADLNKGKYLDDELLNSHPTDFCIGVAGYPEKHSEAANYPLDLKNLKDKVDAGADYIVTQMFFDNQKYFDFVDKCRAIGINVPIIPGLKALATKRQLQILPQTFHIDLPEDLVKAALKCKDNSQVRQLGVEWAIAQSKELKAKAAPVLHYYTMGKSDNIEKIVSAVF